MHQLRAWGLSAALAAGAAAPVAADAPKIAARSSGPPTTLYAKLFGPKKPKVGPVARGADPTAMPTITAPLPLDVVAASLRAEQDAWERRMSVCLKLRQAAMDANDEATMRQVDELERQATSLYHARVAALGVPKVKPESSAALALDRRLGTGTAVTPLTAPAAPAAFDPAVRTAEARTPTDRIREVPQ